MKNIRTKKMSIFAFWLVSSFFAIEIAQADPVNVKSGICEDSTCAHRNLSLSMQIGGPNTAVYNSSASTSSATPACLSTYEYKEQGCTAPMVGSHVVGRDFVCPSSGGAGYWTPWYDAMNTCASPPPITLPNLPPSLQPSCQKPVPYCDLWGGSDGSLRGAPAMNYGIIVYSGPSCTPTYVPQGTYYPSDTGGACPN